MLVTVTVVVEAVLVPAVIDCAAGADSVMLWFHVPQAVLLMVVVPAPPCTVMTCADAPTANSTMAASTKRSLFRGVSYGLVVYCMVKLTKVAFGEQLAAAVVVRRARSCPAGPATEITPESISAAEALIVTLANMPAAVTS